LAFKPPCFNYTKISIPINISHSPHVFQSFPALKSSSLRLTPLMLVSHFVRGTCRIWSAVYSATPSFHSFNFECCANMKVAKFSHLVVMAVTVCQPLRFCPFATALPTFHRFSHFPIAASLIARHILVPLGVGRNCDCSVGLLA